MGMEAAPKFYDPVELDSDSVVLRHADEENDPNAKFIEMQRIRKTT